MSLKTTIDSQIKDAMRAKDQDTLMALRAIKSMILLAETSEGHSGDLTQEMEIKLLTKAAKQRKESAETFLQNNRKELADKELKELGVIEQFLPTQLSEEEIGLKIKGIIEKLQAKGAQDMGKVMGVATKELAGMADGKLISSVVKSLLA